MPTTAFTRRVAIASLALATTAAIPLTAHPANAFSVTAATTGSGATIAEAATRLAVSSAPATRLTLPAPTGRYSIGTRALRLVDSSRRDPLVKARPYRELMVSLWYPAGPSNRPLAPHMSQMAAADWDRHSAPAMGIKQGSMDWAATTTHAREGAPVDRKAGSLPVVLFAPGDGGPRTLGTVLVEELASRGYLVVTVDHTYEADQVEFPGGRVERAVPLPSKLTPNVIAKLLRKHAKIRLADMRFVLDRLDKIAGLRGVMDLSKIGILGQSIGGSVAAQLAHDDPRIDAGVNLDGSYVGPIARTGMGRPFLQFAAQAHTRAGDRTWKSFWNASSGWKRELRLAGAAHGSFTDLQVILPQVKDLVGTIDPARSVAAQRAYITAFFDLHLKGQATHLFDMPDQRYPEITLVS
jgi:predicted dienelactone hydrolase